MNPLELANQYISNDLYLLQYHKLDGLFPPSADYKNKIIDNSTKKNNMAFELFDIFNNSNIEYIILKGLVNAYTLYDFYWERQFSDVDIYVPENQLELVEKILKQNGYIQGRYDNDSSRIIPATRMQILSRRLLTHQTYEYCKIGQTVSSIDVNFKFSWPGINNNIKVELEKAIKNSSTYFIANGKRYRCLSPIINFLHQCIHIYNEAVLFTFSDFTSIRDPKELKLFRMIDIIKFIEFLSPTDILENANKYNSITELSFVIKLCSLLFPESIPSKFYEALDLNNIDVNYYYAKDKTLQQWNINIFERMFNLEKKLDALKTMKF